MRLFLLYCNIHPADVHGLMHSALCGLWCPAGFPEQTDEYEFFGGYIPLLYILTPHQSPHHISSLQPLTGGAVQSTHANILGGGWAVDVANSGTKITFACDLRGTGAQWEPRCRNSKSEEGLDCTLLFTLQSTYCLSSGGLTVSCCHCPIVWS